MHPLEPFFKNKIGCLRVLTKQLTDRYLVCALVEQFLNIFWGLL